MKTKVMQKLFKFINISILSLFLATFAVNIQLVFGDDNGKLSFFGYKLELIQTSKAEKEDLCNEICSNSNNDYCTWVVGHGYCFGYFI